MKQIEKIASAENFDAVALGRMAGLGDYAVALSPEVSIPGKVFAGGALNATGAEISFQSFAPGTQTGFLHAHRSHEELYLFISGSGEFQVDGRVFPVSEGSAVRVAPAGRRSVRNTSSEPLVMICVQYKADSFTAEDAADGVLFTEPVVW